jgi:hypothetical protein
VGGGGGPDQNIDHVVRLCVCLQEVLHGARGCPHHQGRGLSPTVPTQQRSVAPSHTTNKYWIKFVIYIIKIGGCVYGEI